MTYVIEVANGVDLGQRVRPPSGFENLRIKSPVLVVWCGAV
jgi:hypothetical protein